MYEQACDLSGEGETGGPGDSWGGKSGRGLKVYIKKKKSDANEEDSPITILLRPI